MIANLLALARQSLAHNQFLAGGAVLGAISGVVYWLRSLPARLLNAVTNQLFIEVEVEDRDEIFQWVILWLATQRYGAERARSLMATTKRNFDQSAAPAPYGYSSSASQVVPEVIFSPSRGYHWFFYRGKLVSVRREDKQSVNGPKSDGKSGLGGFFPEEIRIRLLTRDRNMMRSLIEEARALAYPPSEVRTTIFTVRGYGEAGWGVSAKRRPRSLESVILREGAAELARQTVAEFLANEDWYVKRNIPYRLGIELEGPPGSGKSSLVAALAGEFGMDLAVLDLAAESLDDPGLNALFAKTPSHAIVLIEDIDCAFRGRERVSTTTADNKVTFSGLLNAIDGVAAAEGRILIITTNQHDILDPALVRPGRIDLRLSIGAPDVSQVRRLYRRFFADDSLAQERTFIQSLGELSLTSMAMVQQELIELALRRKRGDGRADDCADPENRNAAPRLRGISSAEGMWGMPQVLPPCGDSPKPSNE